tara:strand:+ start:2815 stop:3423 length:609 start_codon:yes stop_codon:yes gene_type:complete
VNDSKTEIYTNSLWATNIWSTNIQKFTRKPRKVSENEDMINYIMSDYERNPKINQKSNRYGGWQSDTDYFKKPIFKPLNDEIWKVSKALFPMIKTMRIEQMWSAINFEHSWNFIHQHGGPYHMSGGYYLQMPENSGEIYWRDPRPGAIGNHFEGIRSGGENKKMLPNESDLVLWPAYLDHGTYPSKSKEPRIMISFDLVYQY